MILNKEKWTKHDMAEFQDYLKSLAGNKEKYTWEQRIVNTNLPCLAIPATKIKEISNQIAKGNFLDFLNFWLWKTHQNTLINGNLICKIADFAVLKQYLNRYASLADNWATCDCLKFKITENNQQQFFSLAKEYVGSNLTFKRRIGIIIFFKFIKTNYLSEIFNLLNTLSNEQEYYVNMAVSWFLCESFIKERDLTLAYLNHNNLNKFTINKFISKCRDSFRISDTDKEMLLKFKIK